MFFLIDGHNLIPKIPGMSLESLDDELGLIKQLQIYCRISRDSVEVFFDRAAPGQAGTKNHGVVKVHFIPLGTPADDAIIRRLQTAGSKAQNWTVVTSDRRIRAEAHAHHAHILSSDEFSKKMMTTLERSGSGSGGKIDREETPSGVEEWLKKFNQK